MFKLIESICYALSDSLLLEMANLQPRETGLASIVHVCSKGGANHGPRVKVSNIAGTYHPSDNFAITLENEPRIIGKSKLKKEHLDNITDWVKLNKDHLKKVWNSGDTMTSDEVSSGFNKL